jgi:protein-disulfide isomerase
MRSVQYMCLIVMLFLVCITSASLDLWTRLARAESAPSASSETGVLKEEVERLKTELGDLKKQLADLRQLVSQRPAAARQAPDVPAKVSVADNPSLGKTDAPITIIEFSDYQCPFCQRFVRNTLPALKTDYIDTGKVRYVFRDFPLAMHRQARKAAEAAHCAGEQGKYWEMHDVIFNNQQALKIEDLKEHASNLDLEPTAFNNCLEQGKYAAEVDKDFADGSAAGVTGTPSFFIGKTGPSGTIEGTLLRGAQPITAFRQVVDGLLDGPKP